MSTGDEKKPGEVSGARRLFDLVLLVTVLSTTIWLLLTRGPQLLSAARLVRSGMLPCSSPITYSIGSIDQRFGLDPRELGSALAEAAGVWNKAAGREVFKGLPSGGGLAVNMVYDRRQEALDKLRGMGLKTDRSLAAYKSLKDAYDSLSAGLDSRQAALEARLDEYRRGEASYNDTVAGYNRRGFASPQQKRSLDSARASLESDFSMIKLEEGAVNSVIDTLNAMATTLNQLIVELNLDVEQYNREGSAMGVYEEGHYRVDKALPAIDIYKYSDHDQLVRLLAHEMGHALGLEHVPGRESLMSPVNSGTGLLLRPEDMAELHRACTSPLFRPKRQASPPQAPSRPAPAAGTERPA
ncbi:MAG: matrixin family metalloprotease [Elusimicrobia bacterium]|nr:matrixin family metalloprotease [Elusimicrobiota bacterium]